MGWHNYWRIILFLMLWLFNTIDFCARVDKVFVNMSLKCMKIQTILQKQKGWRHIVPSLSFFSHLFWIAFLDDNECQAAGIKLRKEKTEGGPRAKKISRRRRKKRRTTSQKFSACLPEISWQKTWIASWGARSIFMHAENNAKRWCSSTRHNPRSVGLTSVPLSLSSS